MNKFIFEKAGLADLQILIDYRVEFLEEHWGPQTDRLRYEFKKELHDYFTQHLSNGEYICYLASLNNEVVGIGGIVVRQQPGSFKNPSGKVAYLMNMYTRPAFRRKGICKKLLHLLMEDARASGIKVFELHATPEGEFVYKKEGFLLHGEPTYRKYIE